MNMKCSAVRLTNRGEYSKRKLNRNIQNIEPVYVTKGCHGYSFTFLQSHTPPTKRQPILSVNNIHLPEDVPPLNTGYSLKKWSNKMPRLKSAHKIEKVNKNLELDSEYDMSYDLHNILDCVDNSEAPEFSESANAEEYEIHSDIEELLRRSAEIRQQREDEEGKSRRKLHAAHDGRPLTEDKSRKRHKHRLKKTIRFSFSKPASPQTEQVIRVDVTSNISVEELRQIESSRSDTRTDDYSKNSPKVINECGRKELDGFNENAVIKFDGADEEFIIRCSQLALNQKKR